MKFFPPQLHVQFNSADNTVALEAHEEWERCVKRYRRHYKKIEPHLPSLLRRFHDEQCLHDADVFAPAFLPRPFGNGPEVVIVAQQINTLFAESINTLAILQYTITAAPVIEVPLASPVFKGVQPLWLYDEVDLINNNEFSHEILISDGRVIKLQFSDFTYHIAPLCKEGRASSQAEPKKKQMASA